MTGEDVGSAASARVKFFRALAELHAAAGSPGSKAIEAGVRVTQRRKVSDSTISGWITGPAATAPVPRTAADLAAVVTFLNEGAQQHARGFRCRSVDSWEALRKAAYAESRRSGGPSASTQLPPSACMYLKQVQKFIAPTDGLQDRDHDLADLAKFCDGAESYLRIQAEPWAGKSALLSTFVLDPPEQLYAVGFFATSRLANQSDHTAYTNALLDQLGALLTHHRGDIAAETSHRDGLREDLLDRAADYLAETGRRLVLVVDGLDEDTGNPAIGTPSIAFHLPARPHPNLRVIVASRLDPPIPRDVTSEHPLHHCSRRSLQRSPWARDIEKSAQLELERLISAGEPQQRVLALITAAKGLTTNELQELTEVSMADLNRLLLTGVRGRSFRAIPNDHTPHLTYALAHETLQATAIAELAPNLLGACRDEFRSWATRYRRQGWPTTTPDFLLTRYFDTLDPGRDFDVMAELALDSQRHQRILSYTGSDLTALTEIRLTQQTVCEQAEPDLLTTARLARSRDRLDSRNSSIPDVLPTVWARLGEADRGERLARTLPNGRSKVWALTAMVGALAEAGDHGRAHRLANYVEEVAADVEPSDDDFSGRLSDLARLFREVSKTGDAKTAESLARRLTRPHETVWALTNAVSMIENPAEAHRLAVDAEALARDLPDNAQVIALINLVTTFETLHATDHALQVAADARALANKLPISLQSRALSRLVTAIGSLQDPKDNDTLLEFARHVATEAEGVLSQAPDHGGEVSALNDLIAAFAAIGEFDRAEALARSSPNPRAAISALSKLIAALAASGDLDKSFTLAKYAEQLIATINDPVDQLGAFVDLIVGVGATRVDDHARRWATEALRIALTDIPDSLKRFEASTSVVTSLAKIGAVDDARHQALIVLANIGPDLLNAWDHELDVSRTLAELIPSFVVTSATDDDIASAEAVVRSLPNPEYRRDNLVHLAEALGAAGHIDHARRLTIEIESAARSFDDRVYRVDDLTSLVEVLVLTGERRHGLLLADYLAEAIDCMLDNDTRGEMFDRLDRALADGDAHTAAKYAAHDALSGFEFAISHMESDQIAALAKLFEVRREVRESITAGNHSHAEEIARSAPEPEDRARLLADLAVGVAGSGLLDDARRLLADAEIITHSITHTSTRNGALQELAAANAKTGNFTRAELIAGTIGDRWDQAKTLGRIATAPGIASSDAKRLLARAWLIGPWTSVFMAAGAIAIDVLRAIAEEALASPLPMHSEKY